MANNNRQKVSFFRATWAMYRHDLAILLRKPLIMAASFTPALLIMLLIWAETAATGSRDPVALVTLGTGPQAQGMQQIFEGSDAFRLTDANPKQAQALLKKLDVMAIVTIPANFTQEIDAHDPSPIEVTINNLNLDFTDDIRRDVSDAITQFYGAQGSASPIKVTVGESDLIDRDVEYFQFLVLPAIVLMLVTNGLMTNAVATAEEWETRRIKELLLAPVPRSAVVLGKVLAGFTTAFLMGVIVLSLGAVLGWTRPAGIYIVISLAIIALTALFSTGLGVALGVALRRTELVTTVAMVVSFALFFLSGGIGVLAMDPSWLQNVAAFTPLAYAAHALEQAVFYGASNGLGRDLSVLCTSSLVALLLGAMLMRRRMAS
jgi:ABC-2 type transport system permease protein